MVVAKSNKKLQCHKIYYNPKKPWQQEHAIATILEFLLQLPPQLQHYLRLLQPRITMAIVRSKSN